MKSSYKISALTFILLIGVFSCQKIESLPDTPAISFKNFILRDTIDPLGNEGKVGELTFEFEDGDGDIGALQPDSLSPDTANFNLFFKIFNKIDGEFDEVPADDLETPLKYRVPYIKKEGQNKTLKGEIQVDFLYLLFEYDTIKYSFYLVDRAFHKSNVETTPEIVLTDTDNNP